MDKPSVSIKEVSDNADSISHIIEVILPNYTDSKVQFMLVHNAIDNPSLHPRMTIVRRNERRDFYPFIIKPREEDFAIIKESLKAAEQYCIGHNSGYENFRLALRTPMQENLAARGV